MSGFALVFDFHGPLSAQDQAFKGFRESVARYKGLKSSYAEIAGQRCVAAKWDTPFSLHRGVTVREQDGSWALAVGTVLDRERTSGDSDLGVLLANYLSKGTLALESLDGPFALVIYDRPADRLAIVSDPMGYISVFHARQGERIFVATSALAVAETVHATPSEYGSHLFLMMGGVSGKYTLWEEVERLPAGTILEISHSGASQSVYWMPTVQEDITRLSFTEAVDHTYDLLSWLLRHHLEREGRMWADLTGGFDSRLLTMMMDHCGLPFKATCEGPPETSDVRISSRICQELGWAYRHGMLPENWGRERYERLPQALGKGDAHLDVFKLGAVLWDQEQKSLEFKSSVWGHGGELWRGLYWGQELLSVGTCTDVNYDRLLNYRFVQPLDYAVFRDTSRVSWVFEELKSTLMSVGDRYADLPNTVKLDCILLYKDTGFTGAFVSAVMGYQRVIAPFLLRDSLTAAISTYYKWRRQGRLVRLLMEKVNPVLAGFDTTRGGPALPMRVRSLPKFIPYWSRIGSRLARRASCVLLGRDLFPQSRKKQSSYPRAQWRRETLDCLEQGDLLDHAHMHSGRLYSPEYLVEFLVQARTEEFNQETLLSRIVTLEMALRAVGASF